MCSSSSSWRRGGRRAVHPVDARRAPNPHFQSLGVHAGRVLDRAPRDGDDRPDVGDEDRDDDLAPSPHLSRDLPAGPGRPVLLQGDARDPLGRGRPDAPQCHLYGVDGRLLLHRHVHLGRVILGNPPPGHRSLDLAAHERGKGDVRGLYGLAIWALYGILGDFKAPQFYDKLLPIPLLNLGVRLFDHLGRTGILGNITRWESKFSASAVNRVAMGCWGSIFLVMLFSGAVDAPHPGASIAFWKQAFDEHKHHAGDKLLQVVQTKAEKGRGSPTTRSGTSISKGSSCRPTRPPRPAASRRRAELGSIRGSINVVKELLFMGIAESRMRSRGR